MITMPMIIWLMIIKVMVINLYLSAIQMARVAKARPRDRRKVASSKVKLRGQFTIISADQDKIVIPSALLLTINK